MMSTLSELTHKLEEIFQINRPDLDFGIYRILNSKSREIRDYLHHRLPETVAQALGDSRQAQTDGWQNELNEAVQQAAALGISPDSSTKGQELTAKINSARSGALADEAAVYNHLLTFFSRYYEAGDFISQRRYKGDTYAVPYSGEEVLLHWANKDQYYTKSGENFSHYRFKLEDGRSVLLKLVQADTAKDNRKDNDGQRLFVLAEYRQYETEQEDGSVAVQEILPVRESDHGQTLEIAFEYRSLPKGSDQKSLNADTVAAVLQDSRAAAWVEALGALRPTESDVQRTLLQKHLSAYTQKNSADYFIHKDLGGFLRRELDFYIKNEVMQLDNIQHADSFARIERDLRLIQTLRRIAHDVIDFLAQLENFQKKLWLKKKFVAAVHYLVTLNHIPAALLDEVFANPAQQAQWQNLFAVKDLPPPPRFNFLCRIKPLSGC
ncbi:adenine-specific DNA-methyltransferase [Neisseria sp. HSC-16F19]|nr:restriction endonuclease subunit M [Neisseria sp. HSC-16F19]MCP2039700.1 adenine-specific DNA-methyltransferase [Neisseria sp. HSC-16F19]